MNRIEKRKSLRLPEYDYSSPGAYFITICSNEKRILFFNNEVKALICSYWKKLEEKFPNVKTDQFVVMPNHIHGIIIINGFDDFNYVGADLRVCPDDYDKVDSIAESFAIQEVDYNVKKENMESSLPTLGRIVQWFKTVTTNKYIMGVKSKNWMRFNKKLWQRNYYEHIIRNEKELYEIRKYILENPIKWESDKYHPKKSIYNKVANTNVCLV